jgi:hypothetical protein
MLTILVKGRQERPVRLMVEGTPAYDAWREASNAVADDKWRWICEPTVIRSLYKTFLRGFGGGQIVWTSVWTWTTDALRNRML